MAKNVILYRIKDDECRYIEISNDKIHLDYEGKPIVHNPCCSTRIKEDFEDTLEPYKVEGYIIGKEELKD